MRFELCSENWLDVPSSMRTRLRGLEGRLAVGVEAAGVMVDMVEGGGR
jgi:hypothetical protein